MWAIATALFVAEAAAAPARADVDEATRRAFVRVEGTRFVVGDRPFHFVGANVAVMHGRPHRDALERTLDAVRDDGLRVVRIWALGERPADAPAWARDFAFRVGERGWVERSFAHLDRVLVEARERDLRVIVVLANRWPDYGGIPQYLRWAGIPFVERPSGPNDLELAPFWSSARGEELYRAHLERVVGRTNEITGVAYRDDPTILSWELVNEASAPARAAPALLGWIQRMARAVRAIDPNHLVCAGHIGYERASERAVWLAVQRLPDIDYADAHAYPAAYGRIRDLRELARFVDDRVQLAHHVVHKPFVWGEVGFPTSTHRVLGIPRARWYDAFLDASWRDGVAGALAWVYVPWEDRPREHGIHPDGPGARRTRDVRSVLARHARRWARSPPEERNPILGEARGEQPIATTGRPIPGTTRVHDGWVRELGGRRTLSIPVDAFHRARFERAGRSDDGAVTHFWGEGRGWVRYRFAGPGGAAAYSRLTITMRASSELPGRGEGADAADVSRIRVRIDAADLGTVELPVDDGVGRRVRFVVDDATAVARIFARPRAPHVLTLQVEPGVGAEGLCLYAQATGRASLAPEVEAELPATIELALE